MSRIALPISLVIALLATACDKPATMPAPQVESAPPPAYASPVPPAAPAPPENPAQAEIAPKVAAARAILDRWEQTDPVRAERTLHLVLWTPRDREPAPRYRERLSAIMEDIQKFYAREMQRLGFGPRTIRLQKDSDGLLRIHLVRGLQDDSHYRTESGDEIRRECLPVLKAAGIDADNETLVLFCNLSRWDPDKRTIKQYSPYYAGGNHARGTAWQVDSPILDLASLPDKGNHVSDGQYGHISIGRYNSIFIGGVCHELGHALGLPHNCERADEKAAFGTALMGSGNRTYGEDLRGESMGSFLTLAHGLRLASHPMFSGSVKQINAPAEASLSMVRLARSGKGFTFSAKVEAAIPVYAVLGYMDPAGGGDYDATTTTAIPDAEGNFTLDCQALKPGAAAELKVVPLHANGAVNGWLAAVPLRYPFSVAADGTADITAARTSTALASFKDAIQRRDLVAARAAAAAPEVTGDPATSTVAASILSALTTKPQPGAAIAPDTATLALGDLLPDKARTGYGPATRNHVPDPSLLLAAGGKIFPRGFYAHAPAEHAWSLDGSWKSLDGMAAVADGKDGTVQFQIVGDGKVLWQSKVLKAGSPATFHVPLSGVKSLQLLTSDGGNGNSQDWGLWLDPVLSR